MKFTVANTRENPVNLLRKAGYQFQHHTDGNEMSFVRPLAARGSFPRFHIYASTETGSIGISIHLDAKRETHGRDTRHHGEYDNDGALANEVTRLKKLWKCE